ncbi:MAG: phosphomannose isomerase type II C-terminal cupin domain [Gaiellaceae bacterium]
MTLKHDVRPWGSYTVLDEGADYKVKRITVHAGKRLSYQRHARRAEHWLVVQGAGRVTLDGRDFDVVPGAAVDVPVEAAHRIANTTSAAPLIFIEVQRGDYFGEDDIVRLDDEDYGRADGAS